MIVGLGCDLCAVARLRQALARDDADLRPQLFSPAEDAACRAASDPHRTYALHYAAKEAAVKALADAGDAGMLWRDIVVHGGPEGPRLELTGRAADAAAGLGVRSAHLGWGGTAELAVANVILTGDGEARD